MRVAELCISDIRSIERMVLKPGALNVIQGTNGEGKTTILMSIQAVFEGGHRPGLRRDLNRGMFEADGITPKPVLYAKKGEIKITLDDGTTILRIIREKTSELVVTSPSGLEVPKPQDFVESLASGFGFDPISFVQAKPKERLAYLQRALNISFTPDEVAAASGMRPPAPVDLDGLDLIRQQVYKTRTQVNTLAKQAKGTVGRLSGAINGDESKDWPAEVTRLQAERDKNLAAASAREKEVQADANKYRTDVNADFDKQIADLNKERARQLGLIDTAEKESLAEAAQEFAADLQQLTTDLGAAQEGARRVAQLQVFRDEVKVAEKELAQHEAASTALTSKLQAIDDMKKERLDNLPIPGVELRGGNFYCGGLPFDDLNTGEQFLKAFEVGALQPGALGLMVADKAEHLGQENWDAFQDAALQSGFQVFVTRVSEGALTVDTFEASIQ